MLLIWIYAAVSKQTRAIMSRFGWNPYNRLPSKLPILTSALKSRSIIMYAEFSNSPVGMSFEQVPDIDKIQRLAHEAICQIQSKLQTPLLRHSELDRELPPDALAPQRLRLYGPDP